MNERALWGGVGCAVAGLFLAGGLRVDAHEVAKASAAPAAARTMPFEVDAKGPVKVAGPRVKRSDLQVSGQGYWTFTPVVGAVPVPVEALPLIKGAHGTVIVDAEKDVVYWGLENVGWVGFGDRLTKSWVVDGDPAFKKGNLHGADIVGRKGKGPLVAAADNVEGEVYVSDTSFKNAAKVRIPPGGPYADGKGYAPTDVAFAPGGTVWVTDGYGKAYFMPADVDPLKFRGEFFGGKKMSGTPHGITFDPGTGHLMVSARPEAQVHVWSAKEKGFLENNQLPPGSTVCDVDVWGDYVLAACLDGPKGTPGPLYVIDKKRRVILSTIKPKEELGYEYAQHMHDACWYVTGSGANREVYIIFTAWNPGGIGALKLVNAE
ncbi:MAG: hypothetical protein WCR07_10140 [Verrucomicrobiota bacterium]|jgi:hypothetical protein